MKGTRRAGTLRLEPLERRLALSASAGDLPGGGDLLTVAAVAPQYAVKQAPRLQPGNAPLVGYPGSEFDRVDLLWQTVPAGAGASDSFVVDWRPVGGGDWQAAGLNTVIDTGFEGRLVHSATITGLGCPARERAARAQLLVGLRQRALRDVRHECTHFSPAARRPARLGRRGPRSLDGPLEDRLRSPSARGCARQARVACRHVLPAGREQAEGGRCRSLHDGPLPHLQLDVSAHRPGGWRGDLRRSRCRRSLPRGCRPHAAGFGGGRCRGADRRLRPVSVRGRGLQCLDAGGSPAGIFADRRHA